MTRLVAIVFTAAALTLTACNTTSSSGKGGEQATYSSVTGNLSTTAAFSLDAAFNAAKGAMDDMQYKTDKAEKDALKGLVEARESDGHKVSIGLTRKADKVTDIEVSVGAFGQESKARLILDKMLARLH